MKKITILGSLVIAIAMLLSVTHQADARGRYGSYRIGGYTSHGKGSHYVGGYVRTTHTLK